MEWLHEGCDSDLSADFLHFGASDFPSKNPFKKGFKIVFFLLWRRDPSGFGATISDAVARSSIVFWNSISADRIVMAASRLLRAVAVFVILLSFAAGLRKSYWSGCMRHSDLSADFLHFGVSDFPSKNPLKKCFKIVLHNNSTWLDDKESDDEVLRRQYRHLWEAGRSFQPEFVDAEMK